MFLKHASLWTAVIKRFELAYTALVPQVKACWARIDIARTEGFMELTFGHCDTGICSLM